MRILIKNIKELFGILPKGKLNLKGSEMKQVESIKNAFLISNKGKIESFGEGTPDGNFDRIIDAEQGMVLPTYVDSHTHLVFAQSREEEFKDRINGLSYEQIAERGGGILNSANKLEKKSEDELYEDAQSRLNSLIKLGTGAIEIKSGYGLSLDAELKILRVVKRLKENNSIPIKATFLGAHAIPLQYKNDRTKYVDLIVDEMIPAIQKEGLANYIDVFCEKGYFTVEEMNRVVKAGIAIGLKPKVHVNQFNSIGGIQAAVGLNAVSVDHLEVMNDEDITDLQESDTIPVLLPSCSFFLGIPYGPAKKMMEANLPLCLASDFNPGSTPSGNLNFVFSLACIRLKMTPEEALNALTINAAAALELSEELGSITVGKKSNLIITKPIKNLAYLPYSFGENCVNQVLIEGVPFA